MKKLLLALALLGMLFSVSLVFAEEEKKIEMNILTGEIRVEEEKPIEWQRLTPVEVLAYYNPGVEQVIYLLTKTERVDFFHYILIQEYNEVLVFEDGKFKAINKAGIKKSEVKLLVPVISLLVAMAFMIISNLFRRGGRFQLIAFFTSIIAAVFTILPAYFFIYTIVFIIIGITAILAGIVATLTSVINDLANTLYKVCSIIFYILTIISIVIF